eukprot:TRINITY_DN78769_c0_g1_i1.p1 TRINITY_DN78769_c0_g1~~TRINITY_DN78769_c0_g1_i1.p1  ORF type:complete len:499 (+),score=116.32 TRINITY_DN78769_c0_g1_i1:30-1526(+)
MFGFGSFFSSSTSTYSDPEDDGKQHGGGSGAHRKLYDLLGVEPTASEQEIKKAWRKTAAKHHPDRGGDPVKFQEAQNAFEILCDPAKRQQYDRFGEAAFATSGAAPEFGGSTEDLLKTFFNTSNSNLYGKDLDDLLNKLKKQQQGTSPQKSKSSKQRARKTQHKGPDVELQCQVTLNELYTGCTKKIPRKRKMLCVGCGGIGGTESKFECQLCSGRGIVARHVRVGNFVQHVNDECPDCHGAGVIISVTSKCKACTGSGLAEESVDLMVPIEPGMKDGERLSFRGMGDQTATNMTPGTVFVNLVQTPHPEFERRGDDLVYSCQIALLEALTGLQVLITHLDGRKVKVTIPEDNSPVFKVIKPGDTKTVCQEGMPFFSNPLVKGDMIIKFEVLFPSSVCPMNYESFLKLEEFLPRGDKTHPRYTEIQKPSNVEDDPQEKKKRSRRKKNVDKGNKNKEAGILEEKTPAAADQQDNLAPDLQEIDFADDAQRYFHSTIFTQ